MACLGECSEDGSSPIASSPFIGRASPSRRAVEMACRGEGSEDGSSPALSLVVLGF
jgi:hypothetical protein